MGDLKNWCSVCGEFKFTSFHKCPPSHRTHIDLYDEDGDSVIVHARTPELAAVKRAEQYDIDNDYVLTEGGRVEILIENAEGEGLKFECKGVRMTDYRAEEIA